MKTLTMLLVGTAFLLLNFKIMDSQLTLDERKKAVAYLTSSKDDVLKGIKGLSEAQLNFKIRPESWSIKECMEHIALTESNIFEMVQGTLKEAANPSKRSEIKLSDEAVFTTITDRTYKVKSQEAVQPSGKFASFDGSVKEFLAKREQSVSYVNNTTDDLRNHFVYFSGAFGTMDAYQLIVFMAGHSKRHALQIEEVKSSPDFPIK
jgi:hypothetical protein